MLHTMRRTHRRKTALHVRNKIQHKGANDGEEAQVA